MVSSPHYCWREDLRIDAAGTSGRHVVYCPRSDLSIALGARELLAARLFDGRRSLIDVQRLLAQQRIHLSEQKLLGFCRRLSSLGLLVKGVEPCARPRDPATGISYGPLKSLLTVTLLRFDPTALLDWLARRARWLFSRATVMAGLAAIAVAALAAARNGDTLLEDIRRVYGGGWSWLAWHYPVVLLSIVCHEFGHALACRRYGVRVTEIGVGVYLLLATGWARPAQAGWSALDRRQRLVTILMGPFASLAAASAGVALWLLTDRDGWAHELATVATVSVSLSLIPTLMPMFNGDAYLALSELAGMPRLRQQAMAHVKATLAGRRPQIPPGRGLLYWGMALGTLAGWLLVWTLAAVLVVHWRSS